VDSSTGRLYPSHVVAIEELMKLGRASDAVEIIGTPEAVQRISEAVRAQHKAKQGTEEGSAGQQVSHVEIIDPKEWRACTGRLDCPGTDRHYANCAAN
jgi:uridine phosphorylase